MSGSGSSGGGIGARQARMVFAAAELSLAAKGLLAMVLLHPRELTRQAIFQATSDPMPAINAAVRELEAAGLVEVVAPSGSAGGRRERRHSTVASPTRRPCSRSPSRCCRARRPTGGRSEMTCRRGGGRRRDGGGGSRRDRGGDARHDPRTIPPRNAGLHGARELPQDVADPRPVPARGESGRERRAQTATKPTTKPAG